MKERAALLMSSSCFLEHSKVSVSTSLADFYNSCCSWKYLGRKQYYLCHLQTNAQQEARNLQQIIYSCKELCTGWNVKSVVMDFKMVFIQKLG